MTKKAQKAQSNAAKGNAAKAQKSVKNAANKSSKKSQKTAKKTEKKKPGVIASIVTILQKNKKSGLTKEQILDRLVKIFGNERREKMAATVGVQVPSRLNKEKDLGLVRDDKGRYKIAS